MFLLIPSVPTSPLLYSSSLHSTMFLLIPQQQFANWDCNASLHSTMFLLIRRSLQLQSHRFPVFTFHNVSINTHRNQSEGKFEHFFTFHNVSINTGTAERYKQSAETFTFHNVSINTVITTLKSCMILKTLHSTMFLLILRENLEKLECCLNFTFHNVSINTMMKRWDWQLLISFTFHNVSINTTDVALEAKSDMLLYIPQCFY